MHCITVFCRCSTHYSFQLRALWCIFWLRLYMTISEPKGRFYLQNESIRITNRIDSNRELECSTLKSLMLLKQKQ